MIVVVVVVVFGVGVMPGCRCGTIATMPGSSPPQPRVPSASTRGLAHELTRDAESQKAEKEPSAFPSVRQIIMPVATRSTSAELCATTYEGVVRSPVLQLRLTRKSAQKGRRVSDQRVVTGEI